MAGINKKVGINIKKYRKKKGWSQEQLAFEADLHRAYIGHIERGEKNIGLINLEKIAKALNVTLKNLIG
jgi:transcriptional regulator with XRE-family HTH domain